ncbi:aldehyde dehydrogenase [Methylobacterium sp. Leaf456]|uniref:aldehyde dehydrogenase family protein n=1 Tax=Methylobacterium sp. Leaf456 TaxID=1736382 RepID=UPI0006FD8AE9|nr:aldehyde dehydrogenase family protein [Methylobacterium sp. Leaf456]KQT54059.1 aldehyde dehydrogenase [Methylobacterium sp. Leaf456]
MSQASVRQVAAPKPYTDFDRLPIGGTWRKGKTSRALADRDPYTGKVILEIPQADRSDLDEAYAKAATARAAWAAELPATRATVFRRATEILEARREEVISWLIHEPGSTRLKATLEWASTRAMMLWASSAPYLAERRVLPTDIPAKEGRDRKPFGVVGVISPLNWPLHLTNRSLAPSLAVGNAVVVKPASDTPMTGGLLLAKIFEEAGLPPGVLHVIVGSGSEIGDAFVDHDVPRAISFTGSTPVGRRIAELAAKAPILKRVELELGGNGPFVVLDDADVDQAVETAIFGKFLHQGQICIRINRIIVDETLYEAFLERFADRTKALKVGNPEEPDTMIGPIINEQQLKGLLQRIEDARVSGARQLAGGEAQGLVLPPHVFADVNNDMPLARNEIFGPVAPVIRARGEDDALGIANDSEHGLSGSVFTRDLERGERFARRLK